MNVCLMKTMLVETFSGASLFQCVDDLSLFRLVIYLILHLYPTGVVCVRFLPTENKQQQQPLVHDNEETRPSATILITDVFLCIKGWVQKPRINSLLVLVVYLKF